MALSGSLTDMPRAAKYWSHLCICSQLRRNKAILCFLVSACTAYKCPFHGLFKAMVWFGLVLLCIFVLWGSGVILLFKTVPKHSAEVLSRTPKPQKRTMCWISFTQAWVTVLLAEANVNESTTCIFNKVLLNRNTHKTGYVFDQLMKKLWPEAHRKRTLYFP